MYDIKNYIKSSSLEEAYQIISDKKGSCLLGGTLFLRMMNKTIINAVDLSNLGLAYINKDNEGIHIGSYCTLHSIESNALIKNYLGGMISCAITNIVGAPFRNVAMVGGTVFSKYGFSDLITPLLACNCKVKLYKGGLMDLEDFLEAPFQKDILVEIILPTSNGYGVFTSRRKSKADFALLNEAIIYDKGNFRIAVGARPGVACLAKDTMEYINKNYEKIDPSVLIEISSKLITSELNFGRNMRASAEYRKVLCSSMTKELLERLLSNKGVIKH